MKKVLRVLSVAMLGVLALLVIACRECSFLSENFSPHELNDQPVLHASATIPRVAAPPPVSSSISSPRDTYEAIDSWLIYPDSDKGLNTSFRCVRETSCYTNPFTGGGTDLILTTLGEDTVVEVYGRDSGYYLCRMPDGTKAYCSTADLESVARHVNVKHAVDLREYMPHLEFELLFASDQNITGEPLYAPIPLLEEQTAERLLRAEEIFLADGYSLKIYDAYRPKSAQYRLYDIVRDSRFIGNPNEGNSWHQLGRAVDISLVNVSTGKELEMPTPMHTFDETAGRYSSHTWTEEARANVEYMTSVMQSAGFTTIRTEWWHFQNEANTSVLAINMDLTLPEFTAPVVPAG